MAVVEAAIISVAFFLVLFSVIDMGRAIFMYSELNNAVREGARYAQVNPGETTNIKNRVLEKSPGLTGMGYPNISIECTGGCTPESTDVKVIATYKFTAITQELLGFGPITLRSTATADID